MAGAVGIGALDSASQNRIALLLAIAQLVIVPAALIAVAAFLKLPPKPADSTELVFRIMFATALVLPAIGVVITRLLIPRMQAPANVPSTAPLTITIIRIALVEGCFLIGFVAYLLTGDSMRMLWICAVGAVWAFFVFPTPHRMDALRARLTL